MYISSPLPYFFLQHSPSLSTAKASNASGVRSPPPLPPSSAPLSTTTYTPKKKRRKKKSSFHPSLCQPSLPPSLSPLFPQSVALGELLSSLPPHTGTASRDEEGRRRSERTFLLSRPLPCAPFKPFPFSFAAAATLPLLLLLLLLHPPPPPHTTVITTLSAAAARRASSFLSPSPSLQPRGGGGRFELECNDLSPTQARELPPPSPPPWKIVPLLTHSHRPKEELPAAVSTASLFRREIKVATAFPHFPPSCIAFSCKAQVGAQRGKRKGKGREDTCRKKPPPM